MSCHHGHRRCALCGAVGHSRATCERENRQRICLLCGSLPHRVEGLRCKRCRLPYAPEQPEGIDYFARQPSALARLMTGGDG